MAGDQKDRGAEDDRGAKDEIAQGMSEAGKDAAAKAGKKGGEGGKVEVGSDEVTEGMSKSGSGAATSGTGTGGKGGGSR